MTRSGTLASGAVILGTAGLIAKILGALYRIPLTNLLGGEGMGMYQLVYSLYAVMLSVAAGGFPVAISRLVAERNADGRSAKNVIKSGALAVVVFSLIIASAMVVFSRVTARLQGNESVAIGYAFIAPSIILVGVASLFRGWFQGNLNMYPTAVSQLIEQAVKLGAGLGFAYLLSSEGILYAVCGALLGVTVSELISLLFLAVLYVFKQKKHSELLPDLPRREAFPELMKILFPIAIVGLILPISQFIDSFLIVNLLKATGESTTNATVGYGLYSGTVMSLVNMPVVLTLSLAVVVVPLVSKSRVGRDLTDIVRKSTTAIKLSYVVGIPATLLMFVYAKPIVYFLYPRLPLAELMLSVRLLRIACFSIIFSTEMQVYNALLQALDKTYVPVKNMGAALAAKTVVSVILLLTIGIEGAAYAQLTLAVAGALLNVAYFKRLLGKNVKLVKNVSTILLSGVIMTVFAVLVAETVQGVKLTLLIGFAVSAAAYLISLMLFKVFERGELEGIPFMKHFERLAEKIRFWETPDADDNRLGRP